MSKDWRAGQMSNNAAFDYMLKQVDMPLTVEKFIEFNWFG
jgi:hypothetical protein